VGFFQSGSREQLPTLLWTSGVWGRSPGRLLHIPYRRAASTLGHFRNP
jgi:hypothetical protein